jgi:hypothetical protein
VGSENFTARRETAFLIVSQAPHTQTSEAAADENRVENSVRDTECSLDIALGAVGEKVTEPVICLWPNGPIRTLSDKAGWPLPLLSGELGSPLGSRALARLEGQSYDHQCLSHARLPRPMVVVG